MRLKTIKTLTYTYGEEEQLKEILYQSKEPLLIRIKEFTDQFDLDYFKANRSTVYSVFDQHRLVEHKKGNLIEVLEAIKHNKPYRIFGHFLSKEATDEITVHVPLWQSIPFRPRFFAPFTRVAFFFGGRGSLTDMHFDREHCCNLHLCLSGKKQILLFTEDQSDNLYKVPYIGNSILDFSLPMDKLQEQFPRLKQACGYHVILRQGDMLFMPRNCWHYTRYLEASTSATYIFYPKKLLQLYGYFTGYFFLGYDWNILPFKIARLSLFAQFSRLYTKADGWKKRILKGIEVTSYIFLLPIVSMGTVLFLKLKTIKDKYKV